MGKNIATFLSNNGITANQASIGALFIIFPLFYLISKIIDTGIWMLISLFLAINIKLVLNAIDGIIAKRQNLNTKTGMYLNVGTDIGPDIYIIYLILSKLGVENIMIISLLIIILLYLFFEFLFIYLYQRQNLFYGKDLRTIFYGVIFIFYYFNINMWILPGIYFILFIIHNVGFFMKKYRD